MGSKKSYWLGFAMIATMIIAMGGIMVSASFVDGEGKLKLIEQCNFYVMAGIFAIMLFNAEVKRGQISDFWLGRITLCSVGLNSVLWWLIQGRVYHEKYHDGLVSLSVGLLQGIFFAFIDICLAAMLGMVVYTISRTVVKAVNSKEDSLFHTSQVSAPR